MKSEYMFITSLLFTEVMQTELYCVYYVVIILPTTASMQDLLFCQNEQLLFYKMLHRSAHIKNLGLFHFRVVHPSH